MKNRIKLNIKTLDIESSADMKMGDFAVLIDASPHNEGYKGQIVYRIYSDENAEKFSLIDGYGSTTWTYDHKSTSDPLFKHVKILKPGDKFTIEIMEKCET